MSINDIPSIAFDESGNTGARLLEKEQPVFVLASVRMSEAQAGTLKSLIKTKATELKFNQLKKYHSNHSQLIALLNHDIISTDTVATAIFHKEYCILVHSVDRLIEPLAHNDGIDIYRDGANLAYVNTLFMCTPAFCDKNVYEEYKKDFLNLFHVRDKISITKFYSTARKLIESSKDEEYKALLSPIINSETIIEKILTGITKYDLDSTLSGFLNLVDYWGRKTSVSFDALVDDSKQLSHFKGYVDMVRNINIPPQAIGTDRRTMHLPLKLNNLNFVDSKDYTSVQIADIIAGAANHYYRSLVDEKYEDELSMKIGQSKLVDLVANAVWPHPEITPEELGTVYTGGMNSLDGLIKATRNIPQP